MSSPCHDAWLYSSRPMNKLFAGFTKNVELPKGGCLSWMTKCRTFRERDLRPPEALFQPAGRYRIQECARDR